MGRLEEKLIELGYAQSFTPTLYIKVSDGWEFVINTKNIELAYVISQTEMDVMLSSQEDVDYFQKALDQLKQDLEVLNQYEEN